MFLNQEMSYKPESFLFNKVFKELQTSFKNRMRPGVRLIKATTLEDVFY